MLTEKILRGNPTLIKALTGLPADAFWQLMTDLEARLSRSKFASMIHAKA